MLNYCERNIENMHDTDKSLKALDGYQKTIKRLTKSPFETMLKKQEQMLQTFTCQNSLTEAVRLAADSFTRLHNQLALTSQITAASEMQVQSDAMTHSLQAFVRKLSEMYEPAFNSAASMQAHYDTLIAPIQEIANQWNNSALLAFHDSLANDSFQQQLNSIQKNMTLFSSVFESIAIHYDYVDMPESLIPHDYNYTEVDSGSKRKSEEILPGSINIKKLTIPDAIAVVCNLVMLFFTIITFLQTQQASIQQQKDHEELVRLEQYEISLQETNKELLQLQINATEKNTEYLIELLDQLQEANADSHAPPLPTGSALSCTDSCSQYVHSKTVPAEALNPTEVDDSEHFDTESSKVEQQ